MANQSPPLSNEFQSQAPSSRTYHAADPIHAEIQRIAFQFFTNQSLLTVLAPPSWPHGLVTHLPRHANSARLQNYYVIPGPGLELPLDSRPLPLYGQPPAQFGQPRPQQLPAAHIQLPPISSVLALARAGRAGQLPAASPPLPQAPSSPLPAEDEDSEDDASSNISSDSFPAQKPGQVDEEDNWESYLKKVKKWAEAKALRQKESRSLFCSNAVCMQCNPPMEFNSWDTIKDHSHNFHSSRIRCWHKNCKKTTKVYSLVCFYRHFSTHGCGQMIFVCGDCAKNGMRVHAFNRFSSLHDHQKSSHPSPSGKSFRVNIELKNRNLSSLVCTVVYLFSEVPCDRTRNLLCENRDDELLRRDCFF
ncbi:MAG: hypothetical protein H7A36_06730 [Chlamydiales bacterium]|nr:hypothetical protein [Chlamydiales bacterium]